MSEIERQTFTVSEAPGMPDVSLDSQAQISGTLDWVGMEQVHMPVRLTFGDQVMMVPAQIEMGVSLDSATSRGIHMSRLYTMAEEFLGRETLTVQSLDRLLDEMISSQEGLSRGGSIKVAWELPLKRKALLSDLSGWRQYPVFVEIQADGSLKRRVLGFEILYSSTCPCSAALSRQAVQQKFLGDHRLQPVIAVEKVADWLAEETSIVATPHAQRSRANIKVRLKDTSDLPSLIELIDRVEEGLGTPVQTAVKRIDEQEFARRNAENLMFCEDAARRIKQVVAEDSRITDYMIAVDHQESLHAHNAVARVSRGPWK